MPGMQPTPYTRATAFAEDESSNVGGRSTVRTARVDAELDAIALTLGETLATLELIQRDDGKLRDATVELHTLSSAVLALLASYGATPRGAWVTATSYAYKDLVAQTGNTYICVTAHTSGTFATDLSAGRWLLFSLGSSIGAGAVSFSPTGTISATDVQAAINESDTENRALSAAAQATASAALPTASAASTASDVLGDALLGVKKTWSGAQARTLEKDPYAPLVMGVDIARYGDDSTVFRFRQGRDARSIAPVRFKNRDNMYVANEIARWIDTVNPDAVNIDAGNGTGVIDRLRERKYKVHEVWFGSDAESPEWANKRTEMWAKMRDWLGGGIIDGDPRLFGDLTSPEYDYFGKAKDKIMLESKESLKAKGFRSPDDGDALALTFATRVARRDIRASTANRARIAKDVDYPLCS